MKWMNRPSVVSPGGVLPHHHQPSKRYNIIDSKRADSAEAMGRQAYRRIQNPVGVGSVTGPFC